MKQETNDETRWITGGFIGFDWDLIGIWWDLMLIEWDLDGSHGDWMGFNGDLMAFSRDWTVYLLVIEYDWMGFQSCPLRGCFLVHYSFQINPSHIEE